MTAPAEVRVLFPSGMLGSGFTIESVQRGMRLAPTAIAIDAGSTDSGPYYLGTGTAKSARAAIKRDLGVLLAESRRAEIPLVVGSCATSGTDAGVDWVAAIAEELAAEQRLSFTVARIYSEQSKTAVEAAIAAGRVHPLGLLPDLDVATVRRCEHIVGLMGHEPIVAALQAGADVVLAGRATDTSLVAGFALMNGLPAGPAWHAAKTVECGDLCTTRPQGDGVIVDIDRTGFTVTPLNLETFCTPMTVAAHMLYENANPFRLVEPSGVLDTSNATYDIVDARSVRVEGSRFEPADRITIKLEGSALTGYETMSFVGIAEPDVLAEIDTWVNLLRDLTRDRVHRSLGIKPNEYDLHIRSYGANAVLGQLVDTPGTAQEVGVMLKIRASTQERATAIAKTANPLLLHLPLPGARYMPSYALAASPPETERGASYEFVLNHIVEVADATELFRTQLSEVRHA